MQRERSWLLLLIGVVLLPIFWCNAMASNIEEEDDDDFAVMFDDTPVPTGMLYPEWFKLSFLDLGDDLETALEQNRRGLVVYFGQKNCPYCEALIENNLRKTDIALYAKSHFDFVAIDILGSKPVTDFDGTEWTEKSFAHSRKVNFTPTLLFFDAQKQLAMRLNGYLPPYRFLAALEFVADNHYQRERFADYLQRGDEAKFFSDGDLNQKPYFTPPPYALDRSRFASSQPLMVLFEQGDCHACDVLHSQPLENPGVKRAIAGVEVVQLHTGRDTPVITPDGTRTTSKAWAQQLGIHYTPTLLFYDKKGKEIIRIDSVVGFLRLQTVLEYMLSDKMEAGITFRQYSEQLMK